MEVVKPENADEKIEDMTESLKDETEETETITGSVTGFDPGPREAFIGEPPKEETLDLDVNNVMDYLVELFAKKVESYKFRIDLGEVFVRGDKFKIILSKPVRVIGKDHTSGVSSLDVISTVYIDRKEKTAIGYCEGKDTGTRRECEEKDILDIPREVNYLDYNIKLPEDWLWEFLEEKVDFVETDKYYVNSKKAVRVFFTRNNTILDIFFDEKTGLPARLISSKEGQFSTTYNFLDLSANTVKEKDVSHRDLKDIPSSEYYE